MAVESPIWALQGSVDDCRDVGLPLVNTCRRVFAVGLGRRDPHDRWQGSLFRFSEVVVQRLPRAPNSSLSRVGNGPVAKWSPRAVEGKTDWACSQRVPEALAGGSPAGTAVGRRYHVILERQPTAQRRIVGCRRDVERRVAGGRVAT